jgi:hypothetical protein
MVFPLYVYTTHESYRLSGEVIYESDQIQRVRVSGRNRSIVLQNNRPLLLARGLKNKRVHWSLIEGQVNNAYFLSKLLDELDRHFKRELRANFRI